MSKRLVKTAKQQFEERRNELVYRYQYELCETETYYAYEDSKGHFYILREQDGEYKELRYNQQYEALVFGERFLSAMSERFAENNIPVKPLFDWYASADHDEEPFNLLDIYMCELESEHFTFEDIYEEIPSDEEQWEEDSKNATAFNTRDYTVYTSPDAVGRYESTDDCLKIYLFEPPLYDCFVYPPLRYLHKDKEFIQDLKEHIREFCLNAEPWIAKVEKWASEPFGQNPLPFEIPIIYYTEYRKYVRVEYAVDKVRMEHPKNVDEILKHVDMSPMDSLKRTIIGKIREMYDQGYVLDNEKMQIGDAIAYMDGSCTFLDSYDVAIYLGVNGELGLDCDSTGEWKDLKKVRYLKYTNTLGDLSSVCVEHLYAILQGMVLPE